MWCLLTKRSASVSACASSVSASPITRGRAAELCDQTLVSVVRHADDARQRQQGESGQLGGKGRGRVQADLDARARDQHQVAFAHLEEFGHVADRHHTDVAAVARLAQRRQPVRRVAGLR